MSKCERHGPFKVINILVSKYRYLGFKMNARNTRRQQQQKANKQKV